MERLTKRWGAQPYPNLAGKVICEYKECDSTKICENCIHGRYKDRLADIEDILGDEYDLDRLCELAQANRMIGKEVWAQEKYLKIFREKSSLIQRTTIQYVSLLKGGDILFHTQTCAFPLNEIGKTVFFTREEAALRREQE